MSLNEGLKFINLLLYLMLIEIWLIFLSSLNKKSNYLILKLKISQQSDSGMV